METAVALSGKSRLITQLGGTEGHLADVSRDARVLYIEAHGRHVIFGHAPGEGEERNLSWRTDATLIDLSRDGRALLFSEVMAGRGRDFATSIRKTDGSPAVRLGEGYGAALSPDARWALTFKGNGAAFEFVLWPTGAGEPRRIAQGLPAEFQGAARLPDSRGFVFSGRSPDEGARFYHQDIDGAPPRPLTEASLDLRGPVVSPDGLRIAVIDAYGGIFLASHSGGDVRLVKGVEEDEIPIQWRADGRALYVYQPDRLPVEIFEVDVVSGQRRRLREIVLPDVTGLDGSVVVALTPDARGYAYSFYRHLDEMYLVEGLE